MLNLAQFALTSFALSFVSWTVAGDLLPGGSDLTHAIITAIVTVVVTIGSKWINGKIDLVKLKRAGIEKREGTALDAVLSENKAFKAREVQLEEKSVSQALRIADLESQVKSLTEQIRALTKRINSQTEPSLGS